MTSTSPLTLLDGTPVRIDAVLPQDRTRLREDLLQGFAQLSDKSRASRFLTGTPRLTSMHLRRLVDEVDGNIHVALVLTLSATGTQIGIGRFIRDTHDLETAEVTITVLDDWQGQGAGTVLLVALAEAAALQGVQQFEAAVGSQNAAPLAMTRHARVACRYERREGIVYLVGDLP